MPMKPFSIAGFLMAVMPLLNGAVPPPSKPMVRPPPPVHQAGPVPSGPVSQPNPPAQPFVYDQKPLHSVPSLVKPEVAKSILDRFKAAYGKLGSPRILVYVNRELIDEDSGLRLTNRAQRTETTRSKTVSDYQADGNAPKEAFPQPGTTSSRSFKASTPAGVPPTATSLQPGKGSLESENSKTTHEDAYRFQPRPGQTLADKQTVRDIERLFGRPLRMSGVKLADQKVATQIIAEQTLKSPGSSLSESESARREREATKQVADVVVEILVSSRQISTTGLSGDRVYSVPDIQATAVRLSDAAIIGQATSADILGKDRNAASLSAFYDVRDVSEATALALMDDIMLGLGQ